MATRSKLLAHGTMTTSAVTVYTVPTGMVTIVKYMTFFNPTAGATTTVFVAAVIGGNSRGLVRYQGVLAGDALWAQDQWVVLPAGATLTVQANPSSAVQFTISGAELVA